MRNRLRVTMGLLVAGSLVVAACGGDDDGDAGGSGDGGTGSSSTSEAPTSDADTTAILRTSGFAPAKQLDPVRTVSTCESGQLRAIYDSLIRVDNDGKFVPGLATEWESLDASTLVLTLREDVVFQDGTPFDGEAVKAHLERAKTDPQSTIQREAATISSVTVEDPHTVRIELSQPTVGILPASLSDLLGMVPSPKAVADNGEQYGVEVAVGAGPYAVESLLPNELLKLRTWGDADEYWDADNRLLAGVDWYPPALDKPERVVTGDLDVIPGNELTLASSTSLSGIGSISRTSPTYKQVFVNPAMEPFDKLEVRQALNYAIDRDALADLAGTGDDSVAWGPLPTTSWAHNPEVEEMYPFDPAKAKELLADAGYPDGISFTAGVTDSPTYNSVGQALQDMFKDSGITMELVRVSGAEINNALYQRKEYAAAVTAYAGAADPGRTLSARFGTGGAQNPGNVSIPELDDLLAEGAASTDQDERAEAYQAAELLVMEQALEVPIGFNLEATVFRSGVEGIDRGYGSCPGVDYTRRIYIAK
ncbi:MAG: ABC transporter substrate-binding protein [Acidimicrobiia bacterium]